MFYFSTFYRQHQQYTVRLWAEKACKNIIKRVLVVNQACSLLNLPRGKLIFYLKRVDHLIRGGGGSVTFPPHSKILVLSHCSFHQSLKERTTLVEVLITRAFTTQQSYFVETICP